MLSRLPWSTIGVLFCAYLLSARTGRAQTPNLDLKLPVIGNAYTVGRMPVGPALATGVVLDARFLSRLGLSAGAYFGPRLVVGTGGGLAWAADGMARIALVEFETESTDFVCDEGAIFGCWGHEITYPRLHSFWVDAGLYVGQAKIAWAQPPVGGTPMLTDPESVLLAYPTAGIRWYTSDKNEERNAYSLGAYFGVASGEVQKVPRHVGQCTQQPHRQVCRVGTENPGAAQMLDILGAC